MWINVASYMFVRVLYEHTIKIKISIWSIFRRRMTKEKNFKVIVEMYKLTK